MTEQERLDARLNHDMELYFLEIPKYAREPEKPIRDMTRMERWLAYFANQLSKEKKEELAMAEPAIKDAMDASLLFLKNPAERLEYINRQMAMMDYQSGIRNAKERHTRKENSAVKSAVRSVLRSVLAS